MYLKIGDNDFYDAELGYMEELLSYINKVLLEVYTKINASSDPESEGLCDKGEYFIGVGFCAMQRYLVDVLEDKKIDKGMALKLGPKTDEGLPFSVLINSAANYWKHSPEWHIGMEELDERSQKTIDRILKRDGPVWYPLSEVIVSVCNVDEFSLLNYIPILKKWRQAVDEKIQKN